MSAAKILVTGGSGFIGAALVKSLIAEGNRVRVFDDNSRGSAHRLADVASSIEFVVGDVRDAAAVDAAVRGCDEVHHLAFVNGTEFFYGQPELVLEVGVKGITNVIDACRHRGVGRLVLASSSEVYQTPDRIPTDESAPLVVPDPMNPRYSYGAGKIISEIMALNFGRRFFERVLIFRPHNVYGPDMGWEHVIPQFALRMKHAAAEHPNGVVPFEIQGSGNETRSFCHISDLIRGVQVMRAKGEHLGIYHIGTSEEVTIGDLARRVASCFGRTIEVRPGPAPKGGTPRRCPDISKLRNLGYAPKVSLSEGLKEAVAWYDNNAHLAPSRSPM